MGGPPTLAGMAGGALVLLLFDLIDSGRAQDKGEAFCLENMGYTPIFLTDAEKSQYLALPLDQRSAWEERFLSQELSARIAARNVSAVPPLPAYRDQPYTLGGLRFLWDSLIPAIAPVERGGTVLSGKVERWRTAVLTAGFATDIGPITVTGKAGAIFHQVDYRPQRDPLMRIQGATWCGPVGQSSAGGPVAPSVYCFTTHKEGYSPFKPTGFSWLAGPLDQGFILPLFTKPIILDERAADDLGPLDFILVVDAITPGSISLVGYVTHGGQRVRIWSRRLKTGKDGKIIIPFWDQRITLALDPRGSITTAVDHQGTGKSLRDAW